MNEFVNDLTGASDILKRIDRLEMLVYILIVLAVGNIILTVAKSSK